MLTYTRDRGKKQTIWDIIDIPQRGRQLQEAIARGLPYSTFLRIARYAEMTNAELVVIDFSIHATSSCKCCVECY